ncbi:hypothetical protein [Methanobacterium petrolearium]|uniref:hypothetical protein n=1 Tax=Methanobacterium petrolearium TaxID=710190 RepID=UPI001AE5AD6F|nr:hypothetical protein [Methanobacterium petrolearium]MBP1946739.1 hypothetical protein [Methanobacterium petrolearium]BDZ70985.1 hypothetical protein GCM10025861_15020 [Methanobacterium petrolearium]
MIGFLVTACGTFLLGGVFNLQTQMMDIISSTMVFSVGIGLLLSQLTNPTMSAAKDQQETGASGLYNSFKNSGYLVGTALIEVLLLIRIFGGLATGMESSSLAGNMTTEPVQDSLFSYVETMHTQTPRISQS